MTVSIKSPTSTTGSIQLNGSDVLTIDSSGITLATGKDLTLSSTALDASASGIYLGGTASANLLDNYEEGTWTPEYHDDNGEMGVTSYLDQNGYYQRVGQYVTVWGEIQTSNTGSLTGTTGYLHIGNLPFVKANTGDDTFGAHFSFVRRFTPAANTSSPKTGLFINNSNAMRLYKEDLTNGELDLSVNATELSVQTTTAYNWLVFSGTYLITG